MKLEIQDNDGDRKCTVLENGIEVECTTWRPADRWWLNTPTGVFVWGFRPACEQNGDPLWIPDCKATHAGYGDVELRTIDGDIIRATTETGEHPLKFLAERYVHRLEDENARMRDAIANGSVGKLPSNLSLANPVGHSAEQWIRADIYSGDNDVANPVGSITWPLDEACDFSRRLCGMIAIVGGKSEALLHILGCTEKMGVELTNGLQEFETLKRGLVDIAIALGVDRYDETGRSINTPAQIIADYEENERIRILNEQTRRDRERQAARIWPTMPENIRNVGECLSDIVGALEEIREAPRGGMDPVRIAHEAACVLRRQYAAIKTRDEEIAALRDERDKIGSDFDARSIFADAIVSDMRELAAALGVEPSDSLSRADLLAKVRALRDDDHWTFATRNLLDAVTMFDNCDCTTPEAIVNGATALITRLAKERHDLEPAPAAEDRPKAWPDIDAFKERAKHAVTEDDLDDLVTELICALERTKENWEIERDIANTMVQSAEESSSRLNEVVDDNTLLQARIVELERERNHLRDELRIANTRHDARVLEFEGKIADLESALKVSNVLIRDKDLEREKIAAESRKLHNDAEFAQQIRAQISSKLTAIAVNTIEERANRLIDDEFDGNRESELEDLVTWVPQICDEVYRLAGKLALRKQSTAVAGIEERLDAILDAVKGRNGV